MGTAPRPMERITIGGTLRNATIRNATGVADAVAKILLLRWNWEGPVVRFQDKRWKKECWSGDPDKKTIEAEKAVHKILWWSEKSSWKLDQNGATSKQLEINEGGVCPAVHDTGYVVIFSYFSKQAATEQPYVWRFMWSNGQFLQTTATVG